MAAASLARPLAEATVPALGDSAILNAFLFITSNFSVMPDSGTMSNKGGGFSAMQGRDAYCVSKCCKFSMLHTR